jgi:hypothetical protein
VILFLLILFNDTTSISFTLKEGRKDNSEGCERKQARSSLKYPPNICQEELQEKSYGNLSQLNPDHPNR